jgi:WhiB family redox-sensing transcriptional regulator
MPDAEKYNRLRAEKLPPLHEVAARIKAGESHRSIAAEYGVDAHGLASRLRYGGYRWDTGESETEALRREMRERLSGFMRSWFEPWMEYAQCARTDPEAFFPEKGGSTADAKKVCSSCPVIEECARYALGRNERFGVWAGMSERERRKMLKGDAA